jgi:hypothetical protein
MRLGIMQPYFVPALGYFDLIHLCDEWIVFDTAQYRKKSWMCRNRVLHPDPAQGWQFVTAHVKKHALETPIRAIELSAEEGWREHLVAQLGHYRRAPGYDRVTALLRDAFAAEPTSLARLSVDLLARACALLGVAFAPRYFSELDLALGPIAGPGDWALRISEALGATAYVNPPGGEGLFDPAAFARAGVALEIRRFTELAYAPRGFPYLPMLSILDVLMWCEPAEVRAHLDREKAAFLAGAA